MTRCEECGLWEDECKCEKVECEHPYDAHRELGGGSWQCLECGEEFSPDGDGPDD